MVLTASTRHMTRALPSATSTSGVAFTRPKYTSLLSSRRTSAKMPPGFTVRSLQSQSSSAPLTMVLSMGRTFRLVSFGESTFTTRRFSPVLIQRDASNSK